MTRLFATWALTALLASAPLAAAQIKVELSVPKRKPNIPPNSNDSRIEVRRLEQAMIDLKKELRENPPDLEGAHVTLKYARELVGDIKSLYPDYSTAAYEREIARYEQLIGKDQDDSHANDNPINDRRVNDNRAGANRANDRQADDDSLDETKEFIRKMSYASGHLMPNTYWKGIYTQTKGDAERYFESCPRAVITEREWTLYRHSISGIITHRSINAAVAVRRDDGTCYFYGMTFSEQYNGSWGRLHWSGTDNGTEMDCGNISR